MFIFRPVKFGIIFIRIDFCMVKETKAKTNMLCITNIRDINSKYILQ